MEIITKNAQETQDFGRKLGTSLEPGEILCLKGELGAGKTTFIQGLAEGIGVEARITSPTFILMRQYPRKTGGSFYHVDLYRLEDDIISELTHLGITDVWGKPENIVVIEWADKAPQTSYPQNAKWIEFLHQGESERKIRWG